MKLEKKILKCHFAKIIENKAPKLMNIEVSFKYQNKNS